jgi:hypothetical protein
VFRRLTRRHLRIMRNRMSLISLRFCDVGTDGTTDFSEVARMGKGAAGGNCVLLVFY